MSVKLQRGVKTAILAFSHTLSAASHFLRPRKQANGARFILLSLLATVAFAIPASLTPTPTANAATGINQQINFQGKLVNTNGTNIPDGTYNIEFKIYQDGTGCVSSGSSPCSGTLKWTEDWLRNNTQGVTVTNGIFQVNLGAINTALATSVDFNQSVLWLSINLGSTNATCTPFSNCAPDGEMLPFIRFTASPYALNSDKLDGLDSSAFVQLSPGSAQSGSINVTGSLQGSTAALTGSTSLTLGTAGPSGSTGAIVFKNSTNSNTLTLQSGTTGGNLTFTLPTADGGANSCLITNGSGTLSFGSCAGGTGSGSTLQNAYDNGASITTTNARDIAFTLANTATDSNFTVNIATSSTSKFAVQNNGTDILRVDTTKTVVNTGNLNIQAGAIETAGTVRVTNLGVLQNVTNADASTFFTGGSLSVARGGTGTGTFTLNGVLYGNGTSALGVTAAGTTGQCLVATTGSAPAFASCAGGSGSGVTLQAGYGNSTGGTTPEIKLDTTRASLDIQDADTTLGSSANLFAVHASNGSGLGTTLFSVEGGGNVNVGNKQIISTTRTMPTVVNSTVDIGSFATTYTHSIRATIAVNDGGFSVAKSYLLTSAYQQTNGVWNIVPALSDSGAYSGQDFQLEANQLNNTLTLRLRRTAGSTVGTARITINYEGDSTAVFTPSSSTASGVAAVTTFYPTSTITQTGGAVGINTLSPAGLLSVGSGNVFQVSSTGAVTAVGVNAGTGAIQGSGGISITGNSTIAGTLSSLTGLTSSGSITFSGLNTAGVVHNSAAGVLSTSLVNLNSGGDVSGTLTVGNGGTGAGTFTQYGVLYGNGTSAFGVTAAGASGQCLIGVNAAAPTWGTCSGVGSGDTLQSAYTNSTATELVLDNTRGALTIQDNSTPVTGNLLDIQNNGGSRTYLSVKASGANNTASATISVNNPNASSTATTVSGLSLSPTGTANANTNANIINAVNFPNVTTISNNLFYGLNFGTGYNDLLRYNGNQLISGTGKLQDAALDSSLTYTNLTKVGTLTSGSLGTGFTAVGVPQGGTGQVTLTLNGILYGNNTGAVNVTAAGSSGQCLVANGSNVPVWGSCAGSGSGSTLQAAYDNGNVIATTDARNIAITLANTTTDSNFTVNIATSSTSKFAVQDNGTDLLRVTTAGGTVVNSGNLTINSGSLDINGQTRITNAGVLQNVSYTGSTIAVQYGGTGASTFTQYGVLYGNTTSAIGVTAQGTTGQCLIATNAAAPSWGSCGGSGSGVTLQAAYNNATTPELVLNSTNGALSIRDNVSPISGNLLEVQDNGGSTTYFKVTSSGADVTGTMTSSIRVQSPTFDALTASTVLNIGTTNASSISLKKDVDIVSGADLTLSGGTASQNGYLLADAATNNLLANGDFEQGTYGWTGFDTTVTGGYSGDKAAQRTAGNGSQTLSNDYIPVDPTKDVLQLEGYFKKTTAGTTPGIMYFGYIAYNASKTAITTSPCGTYCYFAASGYTLPADGTWHKLSATTTGEPASAGAGVYPQFPFGTKYVRVLMYLNYGNTSNDGVTLVDHVTLRRINNGPLFVGNNFNATNMTDQYQTSQLYTNSSNNLVISPAGTAIQPATNNAVDLGLSGTTFRTGYFGTSVQTPSVTSAAATALSVDSGTTGALNIGTGANAKTITIGNTTTTTGLVFNSGNNGATFNLNAAGILKVATTAIPTTDLVQITNSGFANNATAGVNGLQVDYFGGAGAIEAGAARLNINPGSTSGGTWNALRVTSNATGPVSGVTLNGIKLEGPTTQGAGTETALYVDTKWDNVLNYVNGANSTALRFTAPTAGNVITFPNETGTVCTTGSICTGYAAGSGSGSYIQNQNVGAQAGANFNISGTGTAATFNAATYQVNGTSAITADTYLRINQSNAFSNGIWIGTSGLRGSTGGIYLGSGGGDGQIALIPTGADQTRRITLNGGDGSASFLGNVGIGTSNPVSGKLQIAKDSTYNNESTGAIYINSAAADSTLILGADAASDIAYIQGMQSGTAWSTRALALQPNGGSLGIGTITPTAGNTLDVAGNAILSGASRTLQIGTSGCAQLNFQNSSNNINYCSNQFAFTTNQSQGFNFQGGNVGVGTTTPTAKLQVSGGAGIQGSIAANTGYSGNNLSENVNSNSFAAGLNMTTVAGSIGGTHTADGKFIFNNASNAWTGGFISSSSYARVADRTMEWTVDTSAAGTSTTQADHMMIGWGNGSLAGTNYQNLANAFYFDKPISGVYTLTAYEGGTSIGAITTLTWGDVVTVRLVLKAAGADYYYKLNNGVWKLGISSTSSTTTPLYPSIAPYAGRFTVHSMHIYDQERTISLDNGKVGIGTVSPGQKLTISGGGVGLDNAQQILWRNQANTAWLRTLDVDTGNNINIGRDTNSGTVQTFGNFAVYDKAVSSAKLYVDSQSTGNVGIGTSGPDSKLHVIGGACIESSDSGCAATGGTLRVGANAPQSSALISAVSPGNDIEFGHNNTAGYHSTIGAEASNGNPFLAFSAEAGTTANTYRTRGIAGSILKSNLAGGFLFGNAPTATADNQAFTQSASLTAAGVFNVTTGYQIAGNAATGNYLRGNGTNFVSSAIQAADLPSGSGNYIQNQTGVQASSNFHISGTGTADTSLVSPVFNATTRVEGNASDSQSAPSFTWTGDTNTGIFQPAADTIALTTGGTEKLRVDSSGNVGIGITSPDAKLDIRDGAIVNSTSTTSHYRNVASYSAGGAVNGAMKIAMPSTKSWSNTMLNITIKGYDYSGNGEWEVRISGYNYSGTPAWINYTAQIIGSAPFNKVTLAHDGTSNVILLGDVTDAVAIPPTTATAWSYPKILVTDVLAGHTNFTGWGSGWSIAPITTLSGIGNSVIPSLPTYLTNTGNFGIGTVTPGYKLDVAGTANISGAVTTGSTITSTGLINAGNYVQVNSKYAIDGTDTYLRLNQQNSFTSGIYTPYNFRADGSIFVGGATYNINGSTSSLNALTLAGNLTANGGITCTDCIALGSETTGNYVATLGTLTGLSTSGNTGEGSTPTLSVTYGSGANTAVQGNTSLTCPSGTGNLTGGGTAITLGTGGTCGSLNTVTNPSFSGLVTASATGTTALAVTGAPAASATSSLVQLGSAIAGGSTSGTYIGANPASFGGNFLDFQVNGTSKFKIDSNGVETSTSIGYEQAQRTLSGGGTVTWAGSGGKLKWTSRFITIPISNPGTGVSGYIQMDQPTTNIPAAQVYNGVARTADANGVVLNAWEALYAEHTPGGSITAITYRIVMYTASFNAPSNWIFVAAVNGDDGSIKLGNGTIVPSGGSYTAGVSGSYVALQGSTPGTQQTGNLNISGSGIFGGNVGIGVTPSYKLDVAGDINISNGSLIRSNGSYILGANSTYTILYSPGSTAGAIYVGNAGDPTNAYYNSSHAFKSQSGATSYATINSSGISTTLSVSTPTVTNAGTLTVSATGANQIDLQTNGSTRWSVLSAGTFQGTGSLAIQTSGTLTVATSASNSNILLVPNGTGNVGIVDSTVTNTNLGGYTNAKVLTINKATGATDRSVLELGGRNGTTDAIQGTISFHYNTGSTIAQIHGTTGQSSAATGSLTFFTKNSGGTLAERAKIDEAGNVKLNENVTSGTTQLDLGASGGTFAVCHTGTFSQTDDIVLSDCTGTPAADYMEMYPVEKGIGVGEIVVPGPNYATTKDGERLAKLTRSNRAYETGTIGIVSDISKAGDFNSIGHNIKDSDNPQPIALNGRVYVRVAPDSAAINKGDFLTTSSTPGAAAKATMAGQMIAKALEDWEPGSGTNTVLVFVTNTYADPVDHSLQGSAQISFDSINVTGEAKINSLIVAGTTTTKDLSVTGTAVIQDLTVMNAVTTKDITVNGTAIIEKLSVKDVTVTGSLTVNGGITTALVQKNSDYAVTLSDSVITADASNGLFHVTLPTAAGIAGRQFTVKKTDTTSNAVIINTTSITGPDGHSLVAQKIDGAVSYSLSSAYKYLTITSDGTNWIVVGNN